MNFNDYFKKSEKQEQKDKKQKELRGKLYHLYYNYIVDDLDDYSHEANIGIGVHGYNYFSHGLDYFGGVELYAPYCFNHTSLCLIWQPVNQKMVQIWDGHVFIDGKEKEIFEYDGLKSYDQNYASFLDLSKEQLHKIGIDL